MKIGVPGEFHEDRWPRTGEDSERRVISRTRAAGPSDTSYRGAKRSSDQSSSRLPCPQVPQWHPRVAKEFAIGSSARRPCLQASQWHPRVAKRASIGTLVRGPSTEALLGQGRVPKGRESVPLQGLRSGSRPGLARNPRLQMVLRQGRVAKGVL